MAQGDLQVRGPQVSLPRRVAASATRFEIGEPLYSAATLSSGVASANTYVLAAADFVTNGTNYFGGIAIKRCLPLTTGTLIAQTVVTTNPIPYAGRIQVKVETSGNVDTDAETLALIGDVTRIDYDATGAADGGELYTVKDTAGQDTDLFQILEGDAAAGTLDLLVDPLAYRIDNDYIT